MDTIYIKNRFVDADPYFQEIGNLINLGMDEYLSNFRATLAGERLFEIISQIILDICTHIVARLKDEKPSTYSDCIMLMQKQGILKADFANKMADLIRMRNLIVHRYGKIDQTIVFASLGRIRQDFKVYESSIMAWLANYKLDH